MIFEIWSYYYLLDGVYEIMMGIYMLLGYEEEKLRVFFFCLDEIFYCFIGKENNIEGFIVKSYV